MVSMIKIICSLIFFLFSLIPKPISGTSRYYGTYLSFGTGDTFIDTQHGHGGPRTPHRKWNTECLDGEAMMGVRDFIDDFQFIAQLWFPKRIVNLWCKFMFPYKPSTSGVYPYYPNCVVRNLTTDSFCFSPRNVSLTVNSFITGLFDTEYQYRIDRIREDQTSLYKCCRTPSGYYIDYTSCYYRPTRDQYWEYYDAITFVVYCETGYVMTGMARKVNPYDNEYHLEWIQCCRVGFLPVATMLAPPTPITQPGSTNNRRRYG